jgi:hypothetical protein
MTFRILAETFSSKQILPIEVDSILNWIRENTDHKDITLHGVERDNKAYRGAFRRNQLLPVSHTVMTMIL